MMRPAKMEYPASARLCSSGGSQLETGRIGTTSKLAWTTQTYGSRLQARVQQPQKAHTNFNATTAPTNGSYLGRGDCVIVKVSPAFLTRTRPEIRRWHDDSQFSRIIMFTFPKLSNHSKCFFSSVGSEQQGVDQLWDSSYSTSFGLLNTLFRQQQQSSSLS